jgi:hypothetical protein
MPRSRLTVHYRRSSFWASGPVPMFPIRDFAGVDRPRAIRSNILIILSPSIPVLCRPFENRQLLIIGHQPSFTAAEFDHVSALRILTSRTSHTSWM